MTNGQDSATAVEGSGAKSGSVNPFANIDLVGVALEIGATFVAHGFSVDKEQLVPLIKTSIAHRGFVFIDVISLCLTFNNRHGSTKSYDYTRVHVRSGNIEDIVPSRDEIKTGHEDGNIHCVPLYDGS